MRVIDLLLPKEVEFFHLINNQVDVFCEACNNFNDLIIDLGKLRGDELESRVDVIRNFEKKGDKIERDIIDKLHETFITPIDREDIHTIVVSIDNALDMLNSSAQKIHIYNIKKPSKAMEKFSKIILDTSYELRTLLKQLEKRKDMKKVHESIEIIHKFENAADDLFRESMAELFTKEKNCINIIKYKEIYEQLENTVDTLDFVAKTIRGIIVKQG